MRNKRGFSLTEVLIYCLLIGFVLTAVYGILNFSLKSYRTTNSLMTLQSNALLSLARIESEIIESSLDDISWENVETFRAIPSTGLNPDPTKVEDEYESRDSHLVALIFPSPKGLDNSYDYAGGVLHWRKWICYYPEKNQDGTYSLIRKEKEILPVPLGTPLSPPSISEFRQIGDNLNRKVISEKITQFEIEKLSVGPVQDPPTNRVLRIVMRLDDTINENEPLDVRIITDVKPRNTVYQ
jgi:hypothetical protein